MAYTHPPKHILWFALTLVPKHQPYWWEAPSAKGGSPPRQSRSARFALQAPVKRTSSQNQAGGVNLCKTGQLRLGVFCTTHWVTSSYSLGSSFVASALAVPRSHPSLLGRLLGLNSISACWWGAGRVAPFF